ncbi:hypothetical protein JCM11641_005154 [Rhodosporidiobolus odoratus]
MAHPRSSSAVNSVQRTRKRSTLATAKSSSSSSTGRTSSTPRRPIQSDQPQHWTDDEPEPEQEQDVGDTVSSERSRSTRKPRRPPPHPPAPLFLFKPLSLISTLLRPFAKAFLLIFPLISPLIPYALLCGGLYLSLAFLRNWLSTTLASLSLPLPLSSLLHTLPVLPLPSLASLCLFLPCPSYIGGDKEKFQLLSAGAARTASLRARHAVDIFDHLVKLADPEESVGLGLHPVECWELATAVRYTSTLDDREIISDQLSELGDLTRQVKEHVIGLNAQGMNAMIWIVHEFTRLEELLSRAPPSMSEKDTLAYTALLDSLFNRISTSLTALLTSLDQALPPATLASDSARQIFTALRRSESSRQLDWDENVDWGTKLLDAVTGENKLKMLRRDLDLARVSAGAVIGVWQALEGTRESLVGYSKHVGHFKAGVVGYHLSGHGLSVSDEVASLRTVMGEMRTVVAEARKVRGSGGAGPGAKRAKVRELDGA